jgi:aminopeptidase N
MQFESKHEHRLGKLPVRTRIFGQMGFGEDWAPESSLYLSGANPLEMVDSPFTRAAGIVPAELAELGNSTNTFHHSGGLNLRGYSGYLAPYQFENGEVVSNYRGTSGAAFNAEIPFSKLSSLNPFDLNNFLNFESYLFGDAGILNVNSPENDLKWGDFRADAGIGAAIKVKWGKYNDLSPLNIRVDLPLFLNRPPSEEEYVEMRYIIGISQTF